MKISVVGFSVAGLMFAGSAMAVEMPAIAKAKCAACHSIEKKVVGPAWKNVAKKYRGKADAEKTVIAHITKGGSFGWNYGMMPPRGLGANDKEIAELAKFILSLK